MHLCLEIADSAIGDWLESQCSAGVKILLKNVQQAGRFFVLFVWKRMQL